MKILGILLLVLLLAIGGGVWWLSSNLNGLVREAVETESPRWLGTEVSVEDVDLAPFSGEGRINGLRVANPTGFEGDAFRLGEVRVAVDMATLGEPVVVIREVVLDGAAVQVEQRGRDINLERLQRNLEQATAGSGDSGDSSGPKVIVERFSFTNGSATVRSDVFGERSVSIPDLELTGLGREGEGATPQEVLRQVVTPLVASLKEAVQRLAVQAGRDKAEEVLGRELEERLGEDGARVLDTLKGFGGFGRSGGKEDNEPQPDGG